MEFMLKVIHWVPSGIFPPTPKYFIYLIEITSRQRGRQREREAGSLLSREPDVGLDPRTLGS